MVKCLVTFNFPPTGYIPLEEFMENFPYGIIVEELDEEITDVD